MISQKIQALKDQARSVREDAAAIASAKNAAWRQELIATARENLGELWQYTSGEPSRFLPCEGCFEINIPGHRTISVHYHVLHSGRAFWARGYYSGRALDVGNEDAWWMVDPKGADYVPTYYHTLGAALLAAES